MGLLGKLVKGVIAGALVGLTAGLASPLVGTTFLAGVGGSFGLIGGTAFLSAIGGAIVGGLTGVVKSLQKKPKPNVQSDLASRLSIKTDPNAGRMIPYGETATAGQLLFKGYSGTNNNTLHLVLALAGCQIDSLVSVTVNGKTITLPASYPYGAISSGNFSGKLWVYFHDGRDTTSPFGAGADLHSLSAWNAKTRKLRGIPAIYIKATVDEDFDGRFEPLFVIKGRKVYDPRLDSTNGGTGSHRVNDETTWEWSDNPVLCAHDYALGIHTNSVQVAGIGFSSSQFDYTELASEADDCEDAIALNGGGTENRYEANGFIDSRSTHRTNLDHICSAMAGRWTFANNKMRFLAGKFHAASVTFGSSDMIGAPTSFRRYRGKRDRVNTVRGVFADPNADYAVQSYPTYQDATAVTADGETLYAQLDLPLTTSYTAAQRIAKIYCGRSRAMRAMAAVMNHGALNAVPLETAGITYSKFNLSSNAMIINDWNPQFAEDKYGNTGLVVAMSFEDEDSAWYSWDEATEEQSLTSPTALVRQASAYPIASIEGGTQLQTDVAQALSDAAAAQSDATDALNELADISADGKLTPDEKKDIIREYNALTGEQSGIDSRATSYGITTEKSTYDTAVSDLTSYLGGLSPTWNDTSQTTAITRSTWNTKWQTVYTTRQALLNKIAQVAGERANYSSVTDDDGTKPENNATKNTNTDNLIRNPGAEIDSLTPHIATNNGGTWGTSVGSRSGGYAFYYSSSGQTDNATLSLNGARTDSQSAIECRGGDQFYLEFWYKLLSGTANRVRWRVYWLDDGGSVLTYDDGSNVYPDGTYTKRPDSFTAPAGASYARPEIWAVNDGNTCEIVFDDLICIQKRDAGGLKPDEGVNLDVTVPGSLNSHYEDTALTSTPTTFGTGGSESGKYPSDPLDIPVDGHRVKFQFAFEYRSQTDTVLGAGYYRIYYRVDGGSWVNIVAAQPFNTSDGVSWSTETYQYIDEFFFPGGSTFEVAITFERVSGSATGVQVQNVAVDINTEFFK